MELDCYFDVLFRYTSNLCTYILYIDLDIVQLSMKIINRIINTIPYYLSAQILLSQILIISDTYDSRQIISFKTWSLNPFLSFIQSLIRTNKSSFSQINHFD
ncbi:unnamed protein product [Musa textilis]